MTAKYHEQDRPVRHNSSRSKIGYGKAVVSNRLWVGGLGPWTSGDSLVREFDRYGLIENIDYKAGSDHAFVRFADTSAASDACRAMRGFPLGGQDRCIFVDFAKFAIFIILCIVCALNNNLLPYLGTPAPPIRLLPLPPPPPPPQPPPTASASIRRLRSSRIGSESSRVGRKRRRCRGADRRRRRTRRRRRRPPRKGHRRRRSEAEEGRETAAEAERCCRRRRRQSFPI